MAPRDIPHELGNSGNITNNYLLVFSPSGFEEFVTATALPAPEDAVAPTERQLTLRILRIAVQNVHRLATDYGIIFHDLIDHKISTSNSGARRRSQTQRPEGGKFDVRKPPSKRR
jgi:hypothetical protein